MKIIKSSGLQKLNGELLEQSANDLHMIQLMSLLPHHLLLH